MIDIKLLEKKSESGNENDKATYLNEYRQGLQNRNGSEETLKTLDQLLKLSLERKETITTAETEKAKQNKLSAEVGQLKREGKDATSILKEVDQLKAKVKELETKAQEADEKVQNLLLVLPNKPHSSVPVGKAETDNKVTKTVGEIRAFTFKPKEHFDLGEKLNIIDFERAGKTTGARFTFLKGAAAQMERALIQFMMDMHSTKHGYTEMIPPFIVNSKSLQGTGQFPKFKEDVFHLTNTDYYLIPTAEVAVTNYYSNETLNEVDLPQGIGGYTACVRSEAGSDGKDTKGLSREHQCDKGEERTK